MQTDTLKLAGLLESQEGRARLLAAFAASDTVILASPVYADCPPRLCCARWNFSPARPWRGRKTSAAVACCGFPEASHTAITLEACAAFARRAGLRWLGASAWAGPER